MWKKRYGVTGQESVALPEEDYSTVYEAERLHELLIVIDEAKADEQALVQSREKYAAWRHENASVLASSGYQRFKAKKQAEERAS